MVLIPASHVFGCVAVGPVGSKLSDRFGCRAVTMTGGFLLCVGLVLSSLATRLFHVYVTLGVVAGNKRSAHSIGHCIVIFTVLNLCAYQ